MSNSKKYLEHFSSPQNVGILDNPDAEIEVAHEGGGCFDRIKMTIISEEDIIKSINFKARACSGTIAAASAATAWAVGKSLEEALSLTPAIIEQELGGVPEKKLHSVELAAEGIRKAAGEVLTNSGNK